MYQKKDSCTYVPNKPPCTFWCFLASFNAALKKSALCGHRPSTRHTSSMSCGSKTITYSEKWGMLSLYNKPWVLAHPVIRSSSSFWRAGMLMPYLIRPKRYGRTLARGISLQARAGPPTAAVAAITLRARKCVRKKAAHIGGRVARIAFMMSARDAVYALQKLLGIKKWTPGN